MQGVDIRLTIDDRDDSLDEGYQIERQASEEAELDRWWSQQVTPQAAPQPQGQATPPGGAPTPQTQPTPVQPKPPGYPLSPIGAIRAEAESFGRDKLNQMAEGAGLNDPGLTEAIWQNVQNKPAQVALQAVDWFFKIGNLIPSMARSVALPKDATFGQAYAEWVNELPTAVKPLVPGAGDPNLAQHAQELRQGVGTMIELAASLTPGSDLIDYIPALVTKLGGKADEAWQVLKSEEGAIRLPGGGEVNRVLRIDDVAPDPTKPHGAYYSVAGREASPHTDVGSVVYHAEAMATNPLVVEPLMVQHARFRPFARGDASAGVAALKRLVGDEEFTRLLTLNKAQLVDELNATFPGPDYRRYQDAYELLEAYAGQEARRQGYDAILLLDPASPAWEEYVALTPEASRQTGTEPVDAYRRQAGAPTSAAEEGAISFGGKSMDDLPPKPPKSTAAQELLSGATAEDTAARVNMARVEAAQRTKTVLETVNRLNVESGATTEAVRGVVSHAETKAAAQGKVTVEMLLNRQPGEMLPGIPLDEQITAARRLRVTSAKHLGELAERTAAGDAEAASLLYDALAIHGKIDESVTGMSAEIGRGLSAHNIAATSERASFDPQALSDLADRLRGVTTDSGAGIPVAIAPEHLAHMILTAQRAAGRQGVDTMARQTVKHRYTNALLEAWINGLLSGPQTHVANFLSNTITTFWAIPERTLAARLHPGVDTGVMKGEATQMLYGLVNGFMDGVSLAAKSFKAGEPMSGLTKMDFTPAITSEALGLSGVPGRAVDKLGTAVRTPGRFLMAADEFFKSINYRMELHAQAYRQAALEGLDGDAMARRIAEIVRDPPASVKSQAEGFAAYQTFTNELGETGQAFMGFANSHPAIRVVLPFIRTPTNIFKYAMERTPLLNLASSVVRADIKAGGVARDMALAKVAMGSMVMATAASLAASGVLTGGGPSDPNLKRMLQQTGWQPYSIKVGDTYYSYNRLDPVGMLLGMTANIMELSGELPSADLDQLAMAAVMGTMESLSSKTYLEGLSQVLDAIREPERGGANYLRGLARSIIPAGVAQVNRALIDPQLREVNGLIDAMRARVPGYSDDLPPRRNLWGEEILLEGGIGPDLMSPIYTSSVKDDPVANEIVRHKVRLAMPSKYVAGGRPPSSPFSEERASHGVELTPQEYDLYVRLAGNELKQGGKGLKEYLADLITTPRYQQQSDGPDGGKAFMIRQAVQVYRDAAQVELRRQSPELNDLIIERQRERIRQRLPQGDLAHGLGITR